MKIPEPARPSLSGYVSGAKLLPWSWVDVRMRDSLNYWIATRSSGYPSSRPVWGIWRDARLYFSSGSLIARNIAADARVQVNLESGDELVIVEGMAGPLPPADLDFWVESYNRKYHWNMPRTVNDVFVVTPGRVLAWMCDSSGSDGGALYASTATEWRFDRVP